MTDQTRVGSPETGPAEPDAEPDVTTDDTSAPSSPGTTASEDTASEDTASEDTAPEKTAPEGTAADDAGAGHRRWGRRGRSGSAATDGDRETEGDDDGDAAGARRSRAALPLVPVLGVLLVLLLAGTAYLFVTRPGTSSVATDDYVDALQAARAGIVDVTSFDYLTLDDDITQIQAVTTGDLTQESVDRLNGSRQALTDAQAVVNTEVVGAAVTAADDRTATVYMVIQSTQTSSASQQAQVQRYRIEVDLTEDGGRWLLSGIQGR